MRENLRGKGAFMKIQCEYCGQMIPETEQTCPYCGAANTRVKRTAYGVPATIQELKDYCAAHHLPLNEMRVFIGENYRGARAFGIYRDENTGNFIVYKNKADGSRAIRYEGNDEAYAVNELYQKIRERVETQRSHMDPKKSSGQKSPGSRIFKSLTFRLILLTWVLAMVLPMFFSLRRTIGPERGYYIYHSGTYYYDSSHSDWYEWDETDSDWTPVRVDSDLKKNHESYYESSSWDDSIGVDDFKDSAYYKSSDWESDDWDYDWDSGSDWDSSYDDWDSDW